ncbi:hypothetical protein ACIP4S_04055 [Streptomyces chartreusis]|uniref:hypothetical protein n=1 Tax=Streptomyces chartreusis TaxID=1969 RepID=UPI00382160E9
MTDTTTGKGPVESGPAVTPVGGAARGGVTTKSERADVPLVGSDESDKFELRLQHAVSGFVDGPRAAVEEADQVVEAIVARFAETVRERRRTLRTSWQDTEEKADTERLRLALRDYRELAERLLHI